MSAPSVASITRSAFLKLRPMSLGRAFPDMSLRSLVLRVRTNSRPIFGCYPLGILDGPGPGEVSLEGAGVALYAVQPGVYVRMTRPLLLDKGPRT